MRLTLTLSVAVLAAIALCGHSASAQNGRLNSVIAALEKGELIFSLPHPAKNDMPMQPNGRWPMHDPTRPQPRVVIPAPAPAEPVAAPTDATILLGARDDLTA